VGVAGSVTGAEEVDGEEPPPQLGRNTPPTARSTSAAARLARSMRGVTILRPDGVALPFYPFRNEFTDGQTFR
jgi:hypothetical protein